ncbi:tRNA 2-selenouridine(34) synthase MnmH [Pontitalea aquivivens]|uniref:tRNA 2-selenouridine(34) synthase MnmH n=1 Tax=Pontitalea aquivivens TaxID=3388663 RepID=UPI00397056E3
MGLVLGAVLDAGAPGFDQIIDVRSPAEYAEDHIPGAINLPVLDNEERARVGTIYKQVSPFDARKIGAALVAQNAARHLLGPLADRTGGWRPLVYCWRGGQRSGSFATILRQVGWRAELVEGGYKSWRRLVVDAVAAPVSAPVVVLDGNTGSAKTELLQLCAAAGHQVIDLEGLANHRGSLFGAMPGGQPGQKAFEGRLALALARLDPTRPVLVEAESSRIGAVSVPRGLWQAICAAPRVRLAVPAAARAAYLARAYADVAGDGARLRDTLARLRPLHPAEVIADWLALADRRALEPLALDLMRRHYDPRYEKHRARHGDGREAVVAADDLSPAALPALARRVAEAAGQLVSR